MIQSQKVEDTSLASAAPMMVSRWMVWIAANEIGLDIGMTLCDRVVEGKR